MRSSRLLALAVAAAACALAGLVLKPAAADAKPFWGLTGQFEAADLEAMADSGTSSVATLLPWHALQPDGPDTYNWGGTDAFVAEAARHDIEVIFILYGTPPHLTSQPEIAPVGTPQLEAAWKLFVRTAVERYGPGGEFWEGQVGPVVPVRAWQVWQEPGLRFFYQPAPNVKKYVKLLRATSNTIRAVDPRAKVLMGGLNDPQGGPHIDLKAFLKRFYKVGRDSIRKKFDAVALHPYGVDKRQILRKLELSRDVMNRADDARKPIWVTEVGWSSETGTNRLQVGVEEQKRRLNVAMKLLEKKKRKLRVRRVLVFTWQDSKPTSPCWCETAGLLDFDGKPKPALGAFEKFAKG